MLNTAIQNSFYMGRKTRFADPTVLDLSCSKGKRRASFELWIAEAFCLLDISNGSRLCGVD